MSTTIRYRKTKKGYSVYLDIYSKGKRTYEYPDIIVKKDYTDLKNILKEDRDNVEFAEKLRDKINLAVREGKYGFMPSSLRHADFIVYFEKIANEKKHRSYLDVMKKLKQFANNGRIPFSDLNETKIEEFIKFLKDQNLSENTSCHYLTLLNVAINRAIRERIIAENPIRFIQRDLKPKRQQPQREFLTIEEIRLLKNTPIYATSQVVQAFIFGCYTGLRISDIKKLKHTDIVDGQIHFRQQKSKQDFQYLPLNDTAKEIINMNPPSQHSDLVFWDLPVNNSYGNYQLKTWATTVGIRKRTTWHTARHSFAVNFLTYGGDIYSLKELLGHSSVAITEVYGKIVNSKKKELINNIPKL